MVDESGQFEWSQKEHYLAEAMVVNLRRNFGDYVICLGASSKNVLTTSVIDGGVRLYDFDNLEFTGKRYYYHLMPDEEGGVSEVSDEALTRAFREVAWFYWPREKGVWPPGTFHCNLIQTIDGADIENRRLLAKSFPEYVRAVEVAKDMPFSRSLIIGALSKTNPQEEG